MTKKNLKLKKARKSFDRAKFFPKKEANEIFLKHYLISQVFPDLKEREMYIQALIKGLEEEPILEN